MDVKVETFPADNVSSDPVAYKEALDKLSPGDATLIFTPDDTHFEIAKYAIEKGIHVMLTKPPVKTLANHLQLIQLAKKHNVLVAIDYHKRFDPMYLDARSKIRNLGDFGYFYGYMSQPKFQLETFKAWAGKSSDISYYLNSHHIDIHCWSMEGRARAIKVTASGATGVAESDRFGCPKGTEDTITLLVQWQNNSGSQGTAVYTASWTAAAKAEVHSQQQFSYMGHTGEVRVDQAHRGYTLSTDENGYSNANPLYMSYTPDPNGYFQGQRGYGYVSIEAFIDGALSIKQGKAKPDDFINTLPTIHTTAITTAILEAGRRSLDKNGASVELIYDDKGNLIDLK